MAGGDRRSGTSISTAPPSTVQRIEGVPAVPVACPLRARQEGHQGGATETRGQDETASDLERSRSEDRVPRPSKLVILGQVNVPS